MVIPQLKLLEVSAAHAPQGNHVCVMRAWVFKLLHVNFEDVLINPHITLNTHALKSDGFATTPRFSHDPLLNNFVPATPQHCWLA
jgi:hypothetical protein